MFINLFHIFLSNPKSLFFSFLVNVVFLSLVRIPFFKAPKLSQNNFKNKIVGEVLVGELVGAVLVGAVLVVGEVVGAVLVGAMLVGAVQVGTVLVGAVLVGAVLVGI